MSTNEATPTPTPQPSGNPPAHPAKGNQRGQTTLAAEIDRWQALSDNLEPKVAQMPGLQAPFAEFQAMLAEAKTVRNQLNSLRAGTSTAVIRRDQLLQDGGDLYTRLTLGLQSIHGPRSPQLKEFGLKPRRTRTRRLPTITVVPIPEAPTTGAKPPAAAPADPAHRE